MQAKAILRLIPCRTLGNYLDADSIAQIDYYEQIVLRVIIEVCEASSSMAERRSQTV